MDRSGYKAKNLKPDFSAALEKAKTGRKNRRLGDSASAESGRGWLVTFTDIMGLMLTFFVMMFAMSVPKQEQFTEMAAALNSELNPLYGQTQNAGPEDALDINKIDFDRALDINYLKALITAEIEKDDVLKTNAVLTPQGDRLVLSLPQSLLFETGKAEIREASARTLYTLGGSFSRMKNKLDLVGHADPRPLSDGQGAYTSNWELSLARAAAVAAAMDKVGYTDPVTIRGSASGRYQELNGIVDENQRLELSRRVDIVIMDHAGKARKVFAD
jgi:chemotaxis protein MotB